MRQAVSVITTCKGRLLHLKQTLPCMLAQKPDEVIVVDYDCPDAAGEWVVANHEQVRVVHVAPRQNFNLSEARNAGAKIATGDILFFVDADIILRPGLLDWMRAQWSDAHFLKVEEPPHAGNGRSDRQYNGTAAIARSAFEAIGGYDTAFQNWGSEDGDLYQRLFDAGNQHRNMPSRFFSSIPHGDQDRVRHVPLKDLRKAEAVSRAYRRAKSQFARLGINLDEPARHDLMGHIEHNFVSTGRVPDYLLSHDNRHFRVRVHKTFPLFGRLTATVTET